MKAQVKGSETRTQILDILAKIGAECPEMRFGQLVANIAVYAYGPNSTATYSVEDEVFLAAAKRFLTDLVERRSKTADVEDLVAHQRRKSA